MKSEVVIEGDVIKNLQEAADWLRESWMYEPYNIYYEEFGEKGTKNYIEYISIEPVRGHEDSGGWDICSLEQFEKFVKTH